MTKHGGMQRETEEIKRVPKKRPHILPTRKRGHVARVIRRPREGIRDITQRLNAALERILEQGKRSSMTQPGGIPRLIENERRVHERVQVNLTGFGRILTPGGIERAEQIGEALEYGAKRLRLEV